MSLFGWLHLERRVSQLEKELNQLRLFPFGVPQADVIPEQFNKIVEDELFRGVTSGSEAEEEELEHEGESVEEREYREEVKWLSQRKQRESRV